ncbi:MAG: dimethylsulfonioproprionate lyase family protein [Pseudomonadota bacterium]
MSAQTRFETLLASARVLVDHTPALSSFFVIPSALDFDAREPVPRPALEHLCKETYDVAEAAGELVANVNAVAPYAEWRLSYTTDEVGQKMLDTYAWFELLGPKGHFRTADARWYIGYWGAGNYYPWHEHEAEEIYYIAAGSGRFAREGEEDVVLGPGDTLVMSPWQSHAMWTEDSGILCFVAWRGEGLGGVPMISKGSMA